MLVRMKDINGEITYEEIGGVIIDEHETIDDVLIKKFTNVLNSVKIFSKSEGDGVVYKYYIYESDKIGVNTNLLLYDDDGHIFTPCRGHIYKVMYNTGNDPEYIHVSRTKGGLNGEEMYPEIEGKMKLYNFKKHETKMKFDVYVPNPVLQKHTGEIGVEITDIDFDNRKGVFVVDVKEGLSAYKGGIIPGDIIRYIKRPTIKTIKKSIHDNVYDSGKVYEINNTNDFRYALGQIRPNEKVLVGISRGGAELERDVVVEHLKRKFTKYTASRLLMRDFPDFYLILNNLMLRYKQEEEYMYKSYFKIETDVVDWKLKMDIPDELEQIKFRIDNKGNLVIYNG